MFKLYICIGVFKAHLFHMKKVRLKTVGVQLSKKQQNGYTLILEEQFGDRKLPILIGAFEAQAILIHLENIEVARPLTHDLFKNFADSFNIVVNEVLINKFEKGIFYALLMCSSSDGKEVTIDSRTSDAVALSLKFDCPIYIDEEVLSKAQVFVDPYLENNYYEPQDEENDDSYDVYSIEELKDMIEEAIKVENYEKAAIIRDELERRMKRDSGGQNEID